MPVKVIRYQVNTGENVYLPGDIVSNLEQETEQQLVEDGFCALVENLDAETEQPLVEDGYDSDKQSLLSTEEFAELKANEQKETLQTIGISPAANGEQRIQQYVLWHNEQEGVTDEFI
ncbi:hypothetical protein ABE354_08565 [Brevibacillus laterosporus]|uniref:hypothetical protein n=1 Tax=Brevibacillus laterosporus TaxID=1465 RepID=UPI003D1B1523